MILGGTKVRVGNPPFPRVLYETLAKERRRKVEGRKKRERVGEMGRTAD